MPKTKLKRLYTIRKFVEASSLEEARRLERTMAPDEIFIDGNWMQNSDFLKKPDASTSMEKNMGFQEVN